MCVAAVCVSCQLLFFLLFITHCIVWITNWSVQENEAKAAKLMTEIQRLEEENQCLRWVNALEVRLILCGFRHYGIVMFPLNREDVNSIKTEIQRETPQKEIEDHVSIQMKSSFKKNTRKMPAALSFMLFICSLLCTVWTSAGWNKKKRKRNQSFGNKGGYYRKM